MYGTLVASVSEKGEIIPPLLWPQFHPVDGFGVDEDPGSGFPPSPYLMWLVWWYFSHHLGQRPHGVSIVPEPDLHPFIFQHHSVIARTELCPEPESSFVIFFCNMIIFISLLFIKYGRWWKFSTLKWSLQIDFQICTLRWYIFHRIQKIFWHLSLTYFECCHNLHQYNQ